MIYDLYQKYSQEADGHSGWTREIHSSGGEICPQDSPNLLTRESLLFSPETKNDTIHQMGHTEHFFPSKSEVCVVK